MKLTSLKTLLIFLPLCLFLQSAAPGDELEMNFENPPVEARPWVFWYWMQASVTREGIEADLEAMADAGIAGAYLMPIKGPADPPWMEPVNQLSPEWWGMVRHAFEEADRLGLKLTLHACDGFAVAGGPWVTPALSMQEVVWSRVEVMGGQALSLTLPQPPTNEDYYRDIAVYAIPALPGSGLSTLSVQPHITTSLPGEEAAFLSEEQTEERLSMREPGWIQYSFDQPFTARSIRIFPQGTNFWAKRLRLEVSDDGENFFLVRQLESPRHGWQDGEVPLTYSIPETRARHFRFVYDPTGTEPGAEDLDSAKWRPSLKIHGITLRAEPAIHQFEGKSGRVWRISPETPARDLPDYLCVDPGQMVDLTSRMDKEGRLEWEAPAGSWILLRMGHTSTGHENYIGGAGKGLEIDKFNPAAAELQFDQWFGEAMRQVGPELSGRVLHGFHVDSWECSSQNWSPLFREAFREQHGYDPVEWLPAMAGIPVFSREWSEAFLHDVRQTIAELVNRNFFGTMERLSDEAGVVFSAESTAPVFVADGLRHHGVVDLPMGEFWLRSPTHDKPNDMLDAISGAHIYGKNIVQAEAFTEVRMAWDEHPGNIKTLGDRNLALGINRFVFHVFTHNPWTDRAPGMTLDGVGLYFQRDQTWWEPGRAWVDYISRSSAMLQQGTPRADIAVFTGEDLPRRSLLPDRLVDVLPGLIGEKRVRAQEERQRNEGQPMQEIPRGVYNAANMEDPAAWVDPLRGYAYDSINPDALLRLAEVRDGKVCLPGGAAYKLLVIPGTRKMSPRGDELSAALITRIHELVSAGATVLFAEEPRFRGPGRPDPLTAARLEDLRGTEPLDTLGSGRILRGPWTGDSLESVGLPPVVRFRDAGGRPVSDIAWAERSLSHGSLFFLANQSDEERRLTLSFALEEMSPQIWDPVSGRRGHVPPWEFVDGRTEVQLRLAPAQSLFLVFKPVVHPANHGRPQPEPQVLMPVAEPWLVGFDPEWGGPSDPVAFERLTDWSQHEDPGIRHYSGTAVYRTVFDLPPALVTRGARYYLDLGEVHDLAEVILNGQPCGVVWTEPGRVEITPALRTGSNNLEVRVTNTWANRLLGDQARPEEERLTWTTAPFRLLEGTELLPAGLMGPVMLLELPPKP